MTTRFKQRSLFIRGLATILIVMVVLTATPVLAQEETERQLVPRLGPHKFTPTWTIPGPFVRTYVRNTLGMGKAYNLQYPLIEIDGETILGLEGDLLFAILDFEYQHAIKDWIAVRARVRVTGRLGNDVQSLISSGITAATGFEFGWLLKLLKNETTMLSATAELSNRNFTIVDIQRWVEGIIQGVPVPLVRDTPSTRAGLGARFAWGISQPFGLIVDGTVGYGEAVAREAKNEVYGRGGTSLSFDLGAVSSVRLGFVGGISYDSFPEGGEEIRGGIWGFLLRIAYNGRDDFIIALDSSVESIDFEQQSQVKFGSTMINLRYYF